MFGVLGVGGLQGEARELLCQEREGLKRGLEACGAELLLPPAPGTDVWAGSCAGCDLPAATGVVRSAQEISPAPAAAAPWAGTCCLLSGKGY